MAFNFSPKIVTDGLVFHLDSSNYRSYVGSGTNLYDLSKNDYNGTLINSPTFTNNYYGGISLNGINQYISFNNSNPILGSSAFSLCAFLDVKTHSNYGIAIYIGTAATSQAAYIGYVQTAQSGTSNTIGGGFYGVNYGSGILQNTGPHYITLTFQGGTNGIASLYVDGILKVSTNYTPNLSSASISIGRANIGVAYYYNGVLHNCSLYNKSLSQAEITQNYNTTKSRFGL
jgi:hypothetical protein